MKTKPIQEIEEDIVDEFSVFDDWMDKYEYIIDLGKRVPLIDEQYKIDEYKVKGCQSQVWLHADYDNNSIIFTADSDAMITKGLIALLIRVLSGQRPEDIAKAKLDFLDKIGMKEHLSPTRSNGLVSMINLMKRYAEGYIKQPHNMN
jgi:cysteine desulfuration protein SufE